MAGPAGLHVSAPPPPLKAASVQSSAGWKQGTDLEPGAQSSGEESRRWGTVRPSREEAGPVWAPPQRPCP